MKVPLIATASAYGITIVSRKEVLSVPVPFDPYALVQKDGAESDAPSQILRDFSSGESVKVFTYRPRDPFEDIPRLQEEGWRVQHDKFLEQIMIDKPDFFRSYHNGIPDVMCFDIEVLTDGKGIFPHANRSPIISIAAKYQDEPPVVFMNYGRGDCPDKDIIQAFLRYFKKKNPDIVVTYNGASFDLPYLYKRSVICGISLDRYSRIKRDWHFKGSYNIPGHLHYDVFRADASKDQSMFGIRNRKMKTVAKWFKIPTIELDKSQISNTEKLIGTDELRKYNESDVEITKALYDIYNLNHVMMAELLGVPLENAVNTYPSFAPKIVLARSLKALGFVFLDSNEARYPTITGRYEGAIVGIYKKGLIPKVWKLDVSGFYPSTMIAFNISPETTRIESIEPFSGKWKHTCKDGRFWFRIPDRKLQKDIVISIDQKKRGVLSTLLGEMRIERMKLKKKIKDSKKQDVKKAAKAQSDALKVLMNAVYGSAALPETVYSDLGVALATISICRYIFQKLIDRYQPDIIEADSVLGNTPIWFRKAGGPADIRNIEDLYADKNCGTCRHFDSAAMVGCTKATTNGEKNATYSVGTKCLWRGELQWGAKDGRTTPERLEVLGRSGWSKVEYIYRHTVTKPCHRVTTLTGMVDVTEDHSLFVDGKEITPTSLSRGDVIDSITVSTEGTDVISHAYARVLGFVCAATTPEDQIACEWDVNKTISDKKLKLSRDVPSEIHNALISSHPDTLISGNRIEGPFVKRILSICFSGTTPKVPRAVLGGSAEIAKAFLLGYRLGNNGLTAKHALIAAGLSHLVRKIGKFPAVTYALPSLAVGVPDGEVYTIAQKAKDPGHKVKRVGEIALNESKVVYDISTADGTFSTALGNILLHNTDGIYVDKPIDEKDVETFVATIVEDLLGPTSARIEIEKDSYGPGWFHLAKNYVLLDLDTGDPIFHGVAFKSTSHCPIYAKILHKTARLILNGESKEAIWDVVQPMLNLSMYTLDDFLMRTTVRQDPSAYANENAMQVRLAQQAKDTGIDVVPGTSIEYIVTKGRQYTLASRVSSIKEVDQMYYEKEIRKALSLFGLEQIDQLELGL